MSKLFDELKAMDLPDIEPLLIWKGTRSLDNIIWVHPYIDTWFKMGDDGCDQDMYIVGFDCGNTTLSVGIKSNWIDSKIQSYFDADNKDLFDEEYIDIGKIAEYLIVILEEDVYVPLPRTNENLNTIKKICNFRQKYSKGQFCFTDEGEEVYSILRSCTSVNLIMDCGFHYDAESNKWGYDT